MVGRAVISGLTGVLATLAIPNGVAIAGAVPLPSGGQVLSVDRSGRFAVTTSNGVSPALRVDLVVGTVEPLGDVVAASPDGHAVVTSSGEWRDSRTGRVAAAFGWPASYVLSYDGATYAVAQIDRGWIVDAPTRSAQPVPRGIPIDLSGNARFVLLDGCAGAVPLHPSCDDALRWDRVTGAIDHVGRTSDLADRHIADDGRVLLRVHVDPYSLPPTYPYLVSDPGRSQRALPTVPRPGSIRIAASGAYAVYSGPAGAAGQLIARLDLDTLANVMVGTSATFEFFAGFMISGDGATVVSSSISSLNTWHVPGAAFSPRLAASETYAVTTVDSVPFDAAAVALNVTVTDPALPGYLTVWSCDQPRPLASNLNFVAGQSVANAAVVGLGPSRRICAAANVDVDVVIDLDGWFSAASPYLPLPPLRLIDTRNGELDTAPNVRADDDVVVAVAGRGGVPFGRGAAMVNLTITNPASGGFATAFPCGSARPLASNVNFVAGQTVAAAAPVPLGSDGSICVSSNVASDVIVDLEGWLPEGPSFQPERPQRLDDTRDGSGSPTVPAGSSHVVRLPRGTGAAVLSVTVTDPASAGFLQVVPCSDTTITVSNVNFTASETVANAVFVAPPSGESVCLRSNVAIDAVVDLEASFGADVAFTSVAPQRIADTRL